MNPIERRPIWYEGLSGHVQESLHWQSLFAPSKVECWVTGLRLLMMFVRRLVAVKLGPL